MNIDWKKTLICLFCFINLLLICMWITRPGDEELDKIAASKDVPVVEEVIIPSEKILPVFDERSWNILKEAGKDDKYSIQYLLKDDNVPPNNKELLIFQTFSNMQDKGTPTEFVKNIEQYLKEWAGDKLTLTVLSSTDHEVIYEWTVVNNPSIPNQTSICRVIQGQQGMHVMHYIIKEVNLPAEYHDKWVNIIKTAKLSNS